MLLFPFVFPFVFPFAFPFIFPFVLVKSVTLAVGGRMELLLSLLVLVLVVVVVVVVVVVLKNGKSMLPKALLHSPVALLPFKGRKPSLHRHFLETGSKSLLFLQITQVISSSM